MMRKIFNVLFSITKYLLFIAAFGITIFIVIQMNTRLEKSFMTSISVFIPFFVLLLFFCIKSCSSSKRSNQQSVL